MFFVFSSSFRERTSLLMRRRLSLPFGCFRFSLFSFLVPSPLSLFLLHFNDRLILSLFVLSLSFFPFTLVFSSSCVSSLGFVSFCFARRLFFFCPSSFTRLLPSLSINSYVLSFTFSLPPPIAFPPSIPRFLSHWRTPLPTPLQPPPPRACVYLLLVVVQCVCGVILFFFLAPPLLRYTHTHTL